MEKPPCREPAHPPRAAGMPLPGFVKALLAAALVGAMLFAHGCHGDEDHELFTSIVEWMGS